MDPPLLLLSRGPGIISLWDALFLTWCICVDRASYASTVMRRYQAVSTHGNASAKICAAGIATRLRAAQPRNNCGSIPGRDMIIFLILNVSRRTQGLAQPPIQSAPQALSSWSEADQSPPPSSGVRTICTSTLLYALAACTATSLLLLYLTSRWEQVQMQV
jgi:hypothetical protein